MNEEQLETFAIRAARGDDVRKWPARFLKDQQDFWRKFVLDLEKEIGKVHFDQGYKKALDELEDQRKAQSKLSRRRMLGR